MTITNQSTAPEAPQEEALQNSSQTFTIFKEWGEYVNCLDSDKEAGELFRALFAYAFEGKKENSLKGAAKIVFSVIKKQIDKESEQRRKRLEACAAAQKRKTEAKARTEKSDSGKNNKKEGDSNNEKYDKINASDKSALRRYEIDINQTNQKSGFPPLCEMRKPPVFDFNQKSKVPRM